MLQALPCLASSAKINTEKHAACDAKFGTIDYDTKLQLSFCNELVSDWQQDSLMLNGSLLRFPSCFIARQASSLSSMLKAAQYVGY